MLKAYEELRAKADEVWQTTHSRTVIRVPIATCSIAAGVRDALDVLTALVKERGLDVDVQTVGERGLCWLEPLIEVLKPDGSAILYENVTADKVDNPPRRAGDGRAGPGGARDAQQAQVCFLAVRIALQNGFVFDQGVGEVVFLEQQIADRQLRRPVGQIQDFDRRLQHVAHDVFCPPRQVFRPRPHRIAIEAPARIVRILSRCRRAGFAR